MIMKTKSIVRLYAALRWLIYILILSVIFAASTIGDSVKPIMLLPAAICISVNERDEMTAALTGIICGLLNDIAFGKLFGYNAILFITFTVFAALLFNHLLRNSIINIVLVSAAAAAIHLLLDYLFYYAIWGYENVSLIFYNYTIPSFFYTVISSAVIYLIMYLIRVKCRPKKVNSLEEGNSIDD